MRSYYIILLCFLLPLSSFAQKWEVGGFLGASTYEGDVHCREHDGASIVDYSKFAYGIHAKYLMSDIFNFRLGVIQSQLEGNEANLNIAERKVRGFAFKSGITEATLMLEWDILGKKRTKGGSFNRILSPYLFGGVGAAFTDPDINFNGNNSLEVLKDKKTIKNTHLAVPVGMGVKYDVTDRFNLGLEAGVRLPLNDYIDGVSFAANPDANDYYAFAGVIGNVKFGKADMDKDGIADKDDRCPDVAGSIEMNGCPDLDGDGLSDLDDDCPNIFGSLETNGCPDEDGDGILDERDDCPEIAGLESLRGCPDSDKDGVKDSLDDCPEVAGIRALKGCPDSDGDGISDAHDLCPEVAGLVARSGCPDSDGDGILDKNDNCPEIAGDERNNGCPLEETIVSTPNYSPTATYATTPTTTESTYTSSAPIYKAESAYVESAYVEPVYVESNNTTTTYTEPSYSSASYTTTSSSYSTSSPRPITYYSSSAYVNNRGYENTQSYSDYSETTTSSVEGTSYSKVLSSAQKNVTFHSGTSKLRSSSVASLKKIAKLMKSNPETTLNISGYTDDLGDDDENQCLSRMRAKSCYKYLKNHGVSEDRINYEGYGETNPIGDNTTSKGRKENRRVEFSLY